MPSMTTVTFDLWQTLLLDNRELGRARAQVRLVGAQNALKRFGEEYDLEHPGGLPILLPALPRRTSPESRRSFPGAGGCVHRQYQPWAG